MPRPPLGAHVSIAGGLPRAVERGEEAGYGALQIFVKSPHQWAARRFPEDEVAAFRAAHRESGIGPLVAHGSYLLNLCATDAQILERSRRGLVEELESCRRLGVEALVVHPGAHLGAGEEPGLELIAESVKRVLEATPEGGARLLLEATAGQGTVLGHRLEQLAAVRERVAAPERLGICLDTCHLYAAGYDLADEPGWAAFRRELDELFEPGAVGCVHLNDSRHPLGSRRDRHANLGDGELGLEPFRRLLRDPGLAGVPMILETPRGEDGEGHARDFRVLTEGAGRDGRADQAFSSPTDPPAY